MNFVAIDFETANESRNSACSLGVCVVENNKIVEKRHWFIKPYEIRFNQMNVWIHGITEEQVRDEKNMQDLWEQIRGYIENRLVIAHNASFDVSVLKKTLEVYNIEYPNFEYICTMNMAKNAYSGIENYKLNTIAEGIGIEFKHHDAIEDAVCCAKVFMNICEKLNIDSLEEIEEKLKIRIGRLNNNRYVPCVLLERNNSHNIELYKSVQGEYASIDSYLYGKNIVFTGALGSMTRSQAFKKLRDIGGEPSSSVTKKTDILVVALRNWEELPFERKSSKLRRAEQLKKEGQEIIIIGEEEFLRQLKNKSKGLT